MNGHRPWTNNQKSRKTDENRNTLKERRKNVRKPLPRPHETEEEAIIRRYHDAQRMARFRAKRKKALEEAKALQAAQLAQLAVISELKRRNITFQISNAAIKRPNHDQRTEDHIFENSQSIVPSIPGQSKYSQLLSVIEEIGKDIKLSYAGSRSSVERLKAGITQAKMLVKDCLLETKLNSKQ